MSRLLNSEVTYEEDIDIEFWKMNLSKYPFFLSRMCLVESKVVYIPKLTILSSLIKKLAMKQILKTPFGRRPSTLYQTYLRLIHAKFEKDPNSNGRVIHV